jgi:ubiquinone/menaquinone biosynthesis C-methylase UbiE
MEDYKQALAGTFNAVADGYDSDHLRFFAASADHMVSLLDLRGHEHVLDVACGTGHATLAVGARLDRGHVTAVDFSPKMLDRARRKVAAADLRCGIEFVEGDMQALPWRARFDAATCAFGIFFVADMTAALAHIAGTLTPAATIVTSCFGAGYMEPMRSMLIGRLVAEHGLTPPRPLALPIDREEGNQALFSGAGLENVRVAPRQMGYFLPDAAAWWQVVWNAGFRRLLAGLDADAIDRLRETHLGEVETLATAEGIWLDVNVMFTTGTTRG